MNYFLGIDATTACSSPTSRTRPPALNHPVTGIDRRSRSNVWHHAAATYDAVTGTWKLYLDGALDRTLALASAFQPRADSIQHAALGTAHDLDRRCRRLLPGPDRRGPHLERRPQRRPRSRPRRDFEELTSGTGLIARYGMNEGSGTTVGNSVAGRPTARPSASPTWVAGFPRADLTPPAAPTGLDRDAPATAWSALAWTANSEVRPGRLPRLPRHQPARRHHRQRPQRRGAAHRRSPTYTDTTAVNGTTYHYVVIAVDTLAATPRPPRTTPCATPTAGSRLRRPARRHRRSYVTFGAAPGARRHRLHASRPGSGATGAGVGIDDRHRRHRERDPARHQGPRRGREPRNVDMNYFLGIDSPPAGSSWPTSRRRHGLAGPQPPGQRHHRRDQQRLAPRRGDLRRHRHLAAVPRRRARRHARPSAAFTPESDSIQHAALGTALTSTGASPPASSHGAIDEARIWNVARSGAQILADRDHDATRGTGLIARYGLNEGTGTTTASSVAGAPSGTLTRPTWTAGPPLTAGVDQHGAGRRLGHDHAGLADDGPDADGQRHEPRRRGRHADDELPVAPRGSRHRRRHRRDAEPRDRGQRRPRRSDRRARHRQRRHGQQRARHLGRGHGRQQRAGRSPRTSAIAPTTSAPRPTSTPTRPMPTATR